MPRVEEAQLQKQRQIEQLVQIGARNRRDEKVVGVAKELMVRYLKYNFPCEICTVVLEQHRVSGRRGSLCG